MNTRQTVILASMMMLFTSMAGCLDRSDDDEEALGNAIVSTFHVGQLVSAIGGDSISVEMMAPSNVPVHDYEPTAADIVRLQESDIFFYHGLNLEPWVETTLSSLENAPTSVQTHAMPAGQSALDYEIMLIEELCEHLNEGPYETSNLTENESEASSVELHAEHVVHRLTMPAEDHEEEEENHTAEDDESDAHEEHGHVEPEETILNPTGCPSNTTVSIFHLEEGEYVLEFESEDLTQFDMIALKMGGGHAHHDHNETDDDHNETDDDHNETDEEHEEHEEHHAGFAQIHVEAEGEYGFAMPSGVDFNVIAGEDGHDHEEEDGGDHEEEEIEAHEDEEEFNYDPHSWLDPLAFKAQANVVLEALKTAFPSGADEFTSNAESYMSQLDDLHADFQSNLPTDSTCTDKTVITNHNAYSYLAKRYGLEFISIHGLDPEGEPSAADIAEAVEEINEEGITVLFIEEYTSTSAVDSIVEKTISDTMPNGVAVEYLYTMELEPKDDSDDYISLMRKSLESLKAGLGC